MSFFDKRFFFGLLTVMTIAACKEPDGIGLEVLPDGEEMPIAWVDSFMVKARTLKYDSIQTSGLSSGTYLIGDFGDPIFGRVQSELFTQYKTGTTELSFESGTTIDSIILNLAYIGSYGNTSKLNGTMRFGVYEMEEDLFDTAEDTVYYSTASHSVSSTPLAEFEFRPDLYSKVVSGTDTLPPSLRIPLDMDLGQRILNSGNLASDEVFLTEFKGLNIRSINQSATSNNGSILYFSMASRYSSITLYYQDSLQHDFPISNSDGVHTAFTHDFPAEIEQAILDSTLAGESKLYIQSMAGLRVKVEIPHFRELNQLGAVAINKAELVIPVDDSVITDYGLPSNLVITGIKEDGSPTFLIDLFEGADYSGGTYNAENGEYVFNIARHLQSLLSAPEEVDYGLYIVNSSNAVNAKRGVFNGTEHPDKPLKLRMTYTIIE